MNTKRRTFLKGTAAASVMGVAVTAGLITPRSVMAAWPKAAFEATDVDNAVKGAYGSSAMSNSSDINLKAPDIAENGAVVPVTITSSIPGTEEIGIVVAKNGTPLAASFMMASNTEGYVSTRIKMGKTSDVIAVVKAGGKLYSAKKEVKVTIGGCGG